MSTNGFLKAFTQEEIDAMEQGSDDELELDDTDEEDEDGYDDQCDTLIDKWIYDEEKCAMESDIDSAWDILPHILDGAGFSGGKRIEGVISFGCVLLSADEVREHARKLSSWTRGKVLEGLRNIDNNAELYRLEFYKEEKVGEGWLLDQFDKLAAFYTEAAEKNLGAVLYIA